MSSEMGHGACWLIALRPFLFCRSFIGAAALHSLVALRASVASDDSCRW